MLGSPDADVSAMRGESLIEAAVADAVPEGTSVAEVADLDFDGDARAAALDLSLVDGRFAPDVLEVAARRAVEAWAEAVDGNDGALLELANRDAARQLLHPGDPSGRTRLVVRGPRVKGIRIAGLDPHAEPPTLTVEVEIIGRRDFEARHTTGGVSGNTARERQLTGR